MGIDKNKILKNFKIMESDGMLGKVLIACEESQAVMSAFRENGLNAYSSDMQPCSGSHPDFHIQGDAIPLLGQGWDLIIAHPPCTFLTGTANTWLYNPEDKGKEDVDKRPNPHYPDRRDNVIESVDFFLEFVTAGCDKVAIENPVGVMNSIYNKTGKYPFVYGNSIREEKFDYFRNNFKNEKMKLIT